MDENLHKNSMTKDREKETGLKDRNYLFDNIKAYLIFSVVIAHYFRMSDTFETASFGGTVYVISFSYIMQGFLFVSGYFSRNLEKCRETSFRTFLFPYLILMPVMFGFRYLIFGQANLNMAQPTMALWYLLTLFYYRYLLKDLVRIKKILPISVVLSLAAGFVPFLNSTLSLGRTFSFLPFFLLGYYFRKEWLEKIRTIPKAVGALAMAGLLAVSVLIAFKNPFPLEALYMKSSYWATGLSWMEGVLARVAIFGLSTAWILVFLNLASKKRTFLSGIGQSTMTVYVLHIIIRYLIKFYGGLFGQDVLSYLGLTAAAVLSLWLFSRPQVVMGYQNFMDGLYRLLALIPQALSRRIL